MIDDLAAMGYSLAWREKVLRAAMVGWMRVLMKVEKGETGRGETH